MNNKFIYISLLLLTFKLFSTTLTLKDNVTVNSCICTFYDVINENEKYNFSNFIILENIGKNNNLISAEDILKILFKNNINNITLVGDQVLVSTSNFSNEHFSMALKTELINYFNSLIDNKYIYLSLNIINTDPEIDLEKITSNYKLDYPKTSDLLKDYSKIKKINLTYNSAQYQINLDITLSANVWISNESFTKDDVFNKSGFNSKIIDFSNLNNYETIIFDPDKYSNSKFTKNIQIGEILRNNYLKKTPLVAKNEQIKVYYFKNPFEVILNAISLQDCFENEKIKIKLLNSKEITGTLKVKDGVKYVEI